MTILEMLEKEADSKAFLSKIPKELREKAELITVPQGEAIAKKHEKIRYVYVLLKGQIKVVNNMPDGNSFSWLIMEPCTFIANLEMLTESETILSQVDATKECVLMRIDAALFQLFLRRDVDFLWLVSNDCAKKALRISYDISHVAYKSGTEKVIRYLLKEIDQHPPGVGREAVLEKTRAVMATEIGMSVKTVNRSLARLEEEGRISIRSGKVAVSNRQLEQLRGIWVEVSP